MRKCIIADRCRGILNLVSGEWKGSVLKPQLHRRCRFDPATTTPTTIFFHRSHLWVGNTWCKNNKKPKKSWLGRKKLGERNGICWKIVRSRGLKGISMHTCWNFFVLGKVLVDLGSLDESSFVSVGLKDTLISSKPRSRLVGKCPLVFTLPSVVEAVNK